MIRALSLFLFLAASAMADCSGTLLPPPQYDRVPRELIDVKFLPPEVVDYDCRGIVPAEPYLGCEWRAGGKWHAELVEGDSAWEACRVRHMNGHISQWEETRDANPHHIGWYRAK